MSRRMGDGPSAVSIVSCSIPAEKWKKGLDGSLLASDQHFADVQFWKNFQRGSATATSFTNLRIANPRSRTGKTLLKELSDAGFEVKAEPVPVSSSGHAILFGVNDIHPRNDDCQHWAVYERLGPLMNESAHEYVIQFLKKYTTCEGGLFFVVFKLNFVCLYLPEFIPFLGQHPGCADIKFIAHGSFGGAFRLSYLTGTDGVRKSCIIKRNDIDFTSFKYLMREKAFLADIEHPNIVKLLHQYVSPNYDASSLKSQNTVFFIEEDGGRTVQGYLREIYYNPSARPVPVQIIYRICSDILQALLYLESRGILHRDIKGDSNALFCFSILFIIQLFHTNSSCRCCHLFLSRF
jgi:serine/threonine protein kinase